MRSRRRWLWLLAAGCLFALAAFLMSRGDVAEPVSDLDKVEFPRYLRTQERERLQKRRTLKPAVIAQAIADSQPPRPKRPRDPVLAALPSKGSGKSAVVLEANALRNSPVGELLLNCFQRRHNPIDEMKKATGIDVTQDLDRVAVTTDGVTLSGNFQNAQWDNMFKDASSTTSYGDHGTIYEFKPQPDPEEAPQVQANQKRGPGAVGRWNNQMIIVGDSVAEVQQIIDRIEGRAPDEAPLLDEQDTYGEVYGVLAANDLAGMMPNDQKDIADKIRDAAQNIKLHVDATNDVAMVADVQGDDPDKVGDLGKTLGAALSLGRIQAQANGNDKLAELMDLARVVPQGGAFRTELAVPMSTLEKWLAFCRDHPDDSPVLHEPSAPTSSTASTNSSSNSNSYPSANTNMSTNGATGATPAQNTTSALDKSDSDERRNDNSSERGGE